jgi:Zn-dependent protease with chaperone function
VTKARIVLALQLAIGLLGVASVALAGLTAAGRVSFALPSLDTLIEACQAILLPTAGVADIAALVLGVLAFAVLGLGTRSALGQLRRTRRFVRTLDFPAPATLAGQDVILFDDHRPLAFCAGVLRPRIYVSTATVDALDDEQLAAVLAHEAHHARQRDPLRVLVARVLADALFFLPAARRLGDRYEDLAELAADRAALRASGGQVAPLASALLSLEATNSAVVGIAPERVDHLMGDQTRWDLPLALLAGAAVTLGALVAVSVRLEATAEMTVNLPLLVAQSCMLVMAVAPLVVGAFTLVRAGRWRLRRR